MLDGLNDWRGAERGERQARDAVNQAKEALDRAHASGNPEAIKEAEVGLRRARQGLVQADLGTASALDNAAERFTGAIDTLKNSRAADRFREERREAVQTRFAKLTAHAAALANRTGPGTELGEAAAGEWHRLREARDAYDRALQGAHGDPKKIDAATDAFQAEQIRIAGRLDDLQQLAPRLQYADGPGAPPESAGQLMFVWPSTFWLPTHQQSIDSALSGVSAARREALKVAVQEADNPEFQTSEMAFRHAMRGPDETSEQARSRANAFIRSEIEQARYYERLGAETEAMAHLGLAMHTLQDSTSPAHEGFQEWRTEWNSYRSREAQRHGMMERSPSAEQRRRLDSATRETWEYFTGKKEMPADFFGGSK